MKALSTTCFRLALCTLGVFSASLGNAQTVYNTVPITGFTDDVVSNIPGPANQSANNDMDGGNAPVRFCFVTQSYRNPSGAAPTTFLPATGFFNSAATPGLSFQLGDYNASNTMRIKGVGIGILTFTTPQAARVLYILGGAGNSQAGPTYFNATINFADGTTQDFNNLFFTDWFGLSDVVALQGVSRVNYDTNVIENSSTDPSLYQKPLYILPANYGKLIRSIDILKTGTLATLNILAVSAEIHFQWQASINNGQTWTDIPNATTATFTVTPTVTTQYRARLICGLQTGTSSPITVTLTPVKPTLTFSNTSFCQAGSSTTPTATPKGGTYSGTNGLVINSQSGIIDLEKSEPGKHTVTYTGPAPCLGQATSEITIEGSPRIVFPNIITANGDGLNDKLQVKPVSVTGYNLQVYNRWGSRILDSSNPEEGWDGKGSNSGVYYYLVRFQDCTGLSHQYKGYVEVIR
jgi:gliding motility-associated-like protein